MKNPDKKDPPFTCSELAGVSRRLDQLTRSDGQGSKAVCTKDPEGTKASKAHEKGDGVNEVQEQKDQDQNDNMRSWAGGRT